MSECLCVRERKREIVVIAVVPMEENKLTTVLSVLLMVINACMLRHQVNFKFSFFILIFFYSTIIMIFHQSKTKYIYLCFVDNKKCHLLSAYSIKNCVRHFTQFVSKPCGHNLRYIVLPPILFILILLILLFNYSFITFSYQNTNKACFITILKK